jgi:hypothetical protein
MYIWWYSLSVVIRETNIFSLTFSQRVVVWRTYVHLYAFIFKRSLDLSTLHRIERTAISASYVKSPFHELLLVNLCLFSVAYSIVYIAPVPLFARPPISQYSLHHRSSLLYLIDIYKMANKHGTAVQYSTFPKWLVWLFVPHPRSYIYISTAYKRTVGWHETMRIYIP